MEKRWLRHQMRGEPARLAAEGAHPPPRPWQAAASWKDDLLREL